VTRAEIYRTRERIPERGGKPGFYVVVSRAFVAENDASTVVCAPVYSQVLGLTTEVVLGPDDGLPRTVRRHAVPRQDPRIESSPRRRP